MIHRLLPILIGLLICLCPLPVLAAEEGSIEISLPKDMAGEMINCTKEGGESQSLTVNENGTVKFQNLEEGIYQVEIPETSEYTFMAACVRIPTWSEEEHRMLYEVTVIPKYTQKEITSPVTGDDSTGSVYIGFGIISLIFIVIMSCHNRFNCDTITVKYSKNGGYNNGNDDDTKNPRCTRRVGHSGPRTID